MKVLRRNIERDGSGSVTLRLEYDEDLWHGERIGALTSCIVETDISRKFAMMRRRRSLQPHL